MKHHSASSSDSETGSLMCIAKMPEPSNWSAKVRTTRSDQNQKLVCGQGAQIRPFGIGQVSHHRGLLPHKTGATTYLIIAGGIKTLGGDLPRQREGPEVGTSRARCTKLTWQWRAYLQTYPLPSSKTSRAGCNAQKAGMQKVWRWWLRVPHKEKSRKNLVFICAGNSCGPCSDSTFSQAAAGG